MKHLLLLRIVDDDSGISAYDIVGDYNAVGIVVVSFLHLYFVQIMMMMMTVTVVPNTR